MATKRPAFGVSPSEMTKKLWAYVKKNRLAK
jgi:hypothetical protein